MAPKIILVLDSRLDLGKQNTFLSSLQARKQTFEQPDAVWLAKLAPLCVVNGSELAHLELSQFVLLSGAQHADVQFEQMSVGGHSSTLVRVF